MNQNIKLKNIPDNLCTADDKGAVTPQQISRKILYRCEDIGMEMQNSAVKGLYQLDVESWIRWQSLDPSGPLRHALVKQHALGYR